MPKADSVLKLLQIMALVAAAVWTLWLYQQHDRESGQLDLEARRLANKQTKDLAELERDSRSLARDQIKFALDQAKLLSDTDRRAKELALRQQTLAYQQSVLTADTARDQLRFSTNLTDLEGRIKGVDLSLRQQRRISYTAETSASCEIATPNKYRVKFHGAVSNSAEAPVEVTWSFIRVFFGTDNASLSSSLGNITAENNLPYLFEEPTTQPINWIERHKRGYYYEGVDLPSHFIELIHGTGGTGATGRLLSGSTNGFTDSFVAFGRPGDRVAVVWLFGLNGRWISEGGTVYLPGGHPIDLESEPEGTRVYRTWDIATLAECDRPAKAADSQS